MKILRVKVYTPTKDYVRHIELEGNEDIDTIEQMASEEFWDRCWYDYEVVEVAE